MFGRLLVWLVVGSIAGTLAGRIVTLRKEGLGRWINLAVGMVGALIGGFLFYALHIDLGLSEYKISAEDLVAAFSGSLLFVGGWWLMQRVRSRDTGSQV